MSNKSKLIYKQIKNITKHDADYIIEPLRSFRVNILD